LNDDISFIKNLGVLQLNEQRRHCAIRFNKEYASLQRQRRMRGQKNIIYTYLALPLFHTRILQIFA